MALNYAVPSYANQTAAFQGMLMNGSPMPVKEERHDEAEINELARKIAETNRIKLAQSVAMQQSTQLNGSAVLARPGVPVLQQYLNMNGTKTDNVSGEKPLDKPVDEESKKGRFGWFDIEKVYLPFLFRYATEKYTSVRMVERKLLNRFLSVLPPDVNSCTCIRSYYITDAESKLLNEINGKHTDCAYGKEAFTSKDLIVRLKDAREFHKFLDLCHKKLVLKKSNASDRCGFFRINGESVVPYTVKLGTKYVPLFYFEGETDHLKLKSEEVDGWDLAYLKFCCKVQGIRNELFASDKCKVVGLEEIKGHFPAGTTFEDYWPAKGSIEPVGPSRMGVSGGGWTKKPAEQPNQGKALQPAVQMQPNGLAGLQQLAGYRLPQQVTQQQLQQLAQQTNQMTNQQVQQLIRAGLIGGGALTQQAASQLRGVPTSFPSTTPSRAAPAPLNNRSAPAGSLQQQQLDLLRMQQQTMASQRTAATSAASAQRPAQASQSASHKTFPGKLTQIKEFPVEKSNQQPYKLQKALIDQKIVPCINVRPYVFHDLMMTLPDFVKHFFPDLPLEKSREMLQEILKVVLYKGNTGHQEILRSEGKCQVYDPVPLVLVKDIMTYMPQMKYMFSNMMAAEQPAAKRARVS